MPHINMTRNSLNIQVIAAGQKKTLPHLRIMELMPALEKTAVPASNRRALKVAVFLRLGCKPVHVMLSGSSYPGMQALKEYAKDEDAVHTGLSGPEYVDCLKKALPELRRDRNGRRLPPAKYLLHDKATSHTAKVTKEYCRDKCQVIVLPTDSPDLTPCDTSFFGVLKTQLARGQQQDPKPWDQRCKLALEAIQNANPDKFIQAMPLRWQACVNAHGWHIEQEYKQLKQLRRAG